MNKNMKECTRQCKSKIMKRGEPWNLIMIMDVAALVDPIRHALLRSSGTFGKQVFEEIVELNQVAICVMSIKKALQTSSSSSGEGTPAFTPLSSSIVASLIPIRPTIIQRSITLHTIVINCSASHARLQDLTQIVERSQIDLQTLRCINCKDDTMRIASIMGSKMRPEKVVIEVVDHLSRIPEGLFEACVYMKEFTILGHGLRNIATFPTKFLKDCMQLKNVDLSGFSNITSLSSDFMMNCHALQTMDLSFMSNVTKCGSILEGCTALTSIDLGPLSKLQAITGEFLKGCSGLTSIDLAPLANVTSITKPFLSGCSKLRSVDMSVMTGVWGGSGAMCWGFLEGCAGLQTVNLEVFRPTTTTTSSSNSCGGYVRMRPKMSVVTTVEGSFLSKCSGIVSPIDFSPLSTVTTIKTGFLFKCTGLKAVDLTPFSSVTEIGDRFLEGCKALATLDLSPLARAHKIGPFFLALCSGLTTVNISQLTNIKEIPDQFLQGCSSLKSIDLTPFSNHVSKVGEQFMAGCSKLKVIDLEPFSKVQSISCSFLQGCGGLVEVDTSPMVCLQSIGSAFLKDCCGMKKVCLSAFNEKSPASDTAATGDSQSATQTPPTAFVTTIPAGFLRNCSALEKIDLSPLERVITIRGNFMTQCSGLKEGVDLRPLRAITTIYRDGFLEGVPKGITVTKSDAVTAALRNYTEF